jgi:hypothetical protein
MQCDCEAGARHAVSLVLIPGSLSSKKCGEHHRPRIHSRRHSPSRAGVNQTSGDENEAHCMPRPGLTDTASHRLSQLAGCSDSPTAPTVLAAVGCSVAGCCARQRIAASGLGRRGCPCRRWPGRKSEGHNYHNRNRQQHLDPPRNRATSPRATSPPSNLESTAPRPRAVDVRHVGRVLHARVYSSSIAGAVRHGHTPYRTNTAGP